MMPMQGGSAGPSDKIGTPCLDQIAAMR